MTAKESIFSLRVLENKPLNHNTFEITLVADDFLLPEFVVSSFSFIYTDDLKNKAPYTPIIADLTKVTFAIKTYPNGLISNFVQKKKRDDMLKVSGPIQKLLYENGKYRDILMIAGGTGITPMLQILSHASMQITKPNFTLFFCNLSKDDIFLRHLLLKYASFLKIIHVLEKEVSEESEGFQVAKRSFSKLETFSDQEKILYGRINTKYVDDEVNIEKELLYDFCYVCGPPGFIEVICGPKNLDKTQGKLTGILKEVGFNSEQVYKF